MRPIAVLLLTVLASGCLTSRSYVDGAFPKVAYQDVGSVRLADELELLVEFQFVGVSNLSLSNEVREKAVLVLRRTGAFGAVTSRGGPNAARLDLIVNRLDDVNAEMLKGFGTGLTLGLVGNTLTDGYEVQARYRSSLDAEPVLHRYEHAIYTTTGHESAPEGLDPMNGDDAFERLLEEILLKLVQDLEGEAAAG